jgi:hypothetical protein
VELVKNLVCNFYALNIEPYVIFALDDGLCGALRDVDAPCYFDRKHGVGVGQIQFWNLTVSDAVITTVGTPFI